MTNSIAIIDEDIRGWADENMEYLKSKYSGVLKAGKNGDLPLLVSDPLIASYCKSEKCDLFTGDKKSYTHYFDSDVHTIQISKFEYGKERKKPIFLIRIID